MNGQWLETTYFRSKVVIKIIIQLAMSHVNHNKAMHELACANVYTIDGRDNVFKSQNIQKLKLMTDH